MSNGDSVTELTGNKLDVKKLVEGANGIEGFVYGNITSVAISPDGTKVAASIQHSDYHKAGVVTVFDCNSDGSISNPKFYATGVQPDMVTFAGKTLYYYLYSADKIYKLVQNVVVDDIGLVSVTQDQCSTDVLTSAELVLEQETITNGIPSTGDGTMTVLRKTQRA